MFKNNIWLFFFLAIFTLISIIYAEGTALELNLQTVDKDTPFFERVKEKELGVKQQLKMVKVASCPQVSVPPATEAVVLYYSEVKLGSLQQNYGILVDFEGKDKLLWVDSNADGDFSQEKSYQIFKSDRYPGINVYYSPEPIVFQITYSEAGQANKILLQFDLPFLLISRKGHADYLFLRTRTWLTGMVEDNGEELRVAIVDVDDNGNYNDPDDLFFVDQNFDMNFEVKEGKTIKKAGSFKLKNKTRYTPDFQFLPKKIMVEGKR